MRIKANSTIFIGRNAGSAIAAGNSYLKRIKRKKNREFIMNMECHRGQGQGGRQWWSVCEIGAMKGAGGASCQGWQLCAAWNKCFTAVTQEI